MNLIEPLFQMVKQLEDAGHSNLGRRLLDSSQKVVRDPIDLRALRGLNDVKSEIRQLDGGPDTDALEEFFETSVKTLEGGLRDTGPRKHNSSELSNIQAAADKHIDRVWKVYFFIGSLLTFLISVGLGIGAYLFTDSIHSMQSNVSDQVTGYMESQTPLIVDAMNKTVKIYQDDLDKMKEDHEIRFESTLTELNSRVDAKLQEYLGRADKIFQALEEQQAEISNQSTE